MEDECQIYIFNFSWLKNSETFKCSVSYAMNFALIW